MGGMIDTNFGTGTDSPASARHQVMVATNDVQKP
jgi:hypothetical protein